MLLITFLFIVASRALFILIQIWELLLLWFEAWEGFLFVFFQALITEVCDDTEIAELKLKVINFFTCCLISVSLLSCWPYRRYSEKWNSIMKIEYSGVWLYCIQLVVGTIPACTLTRKNEFQELCIVQGKKYLHCILSLAKTIDWSKEFYKNKNYISINLKFYICDSACNLCLKHIWNYIYLLLLNKNLI